MIYSDAFRKIMRKEKASFELEAFLRAEVRAGYLGKAKDKVFYTHGAVAAFSAGLKSEGQSLTPVAVFSAGLIFV